MFIKCAPGGTRTHGETCVYLIKSQDRSPTTDTGAKIKTIEGYWASLITPPPKYISKVSSSLR